MDVYAAIVQKIIEQQETIIGPVALTRAKQVQGLDIDWQTKTVLIKSDPRRVIDDLVGQYEALFGKISVEVCKEAVSRIASRLTREQLPTSLQ